MIFLALILLAALHFATGYGILRLFKTRAKLFPYIALSIMIGVGIASLLPWMLQLLYIPITTSSVFGSIILVAVLANVHTLLYWRTQPPSLDFGAFPKFKIYEVPALAVLGVVLFVAAWRCYYFPAYARDALSGPETIALYAMKEHSFINSVFNVNLESTNNQFKSPFFASLQVMYRMAGFSFGNTWLTMLVVPFYVFLYYALNQKLHPLLSGLLLIAFTVVPEAYAYQVIVLYDYPTMVFFALGFYFIVQYFNTDNKQDMYLAILLMAISVYIRTETLVLVGMTLPAFLLHAYRNKTSYKQPLLLFVGMMVVCFLLYFVPTEIYNNHYLPQEYAVGSLVNKNLTDLNPFFTRLSEMTTDVMFGDRGMQLWGYFYYLFLILLIAELIIKRKVNREAQNWLYAVLIIYIGLPLLGYVLPLMDLQNTTKRSLFKILPLMLLYMGSNGLLMGLSAKLHAWELPKLKVEKLAVTTAATRKRK